MAAARTVAMRLIMSGSMMLRVAPIGIRIGDFNHVFISASLFHMLQMAMVEIINVILMLNGNMAAARTMHMRLIGGGHGASLSERRISLASQARQRLSRDNGSLGLISRAFSRVQDLPSQGTKLITRSSGRDRFEYAALAMSAQGHERHFRPDGAMPAIASIATNLPTSLKVG